VTNLIVLMLVLAAPLAIAHSASPVKTIQPRRCHICLISSVTHMTKTKWEKVTDERSRLAGAKVRTKSASPAGGGLPDAGLAGRGRGCRAECCRASLL
jgi:hypothetical protein